MEGSAVRVLVGLGVRLGCTVGGWFALDSVQVGGSTIGEGGCDGGVGGSSVGAAGEMKVEQEPRSIPVKIILSDIWKRRLGFILDHHYRWNGEGFKRE